MLSYRITAQSLKSACVTIPYFRPKSSFGPDGTNVRKMLKNFLSVEDALLHSLAIFITVSKPD